MEVSIFTSAYVFGRRAPHTKAAGGLTDDVIYFNLASGLDCWRRHLRTSDGSAMKMINYFPNPPALVFGAQIRIPYISTAVMGSIRNNLKWSSHPSAHCQSK